MDEPYLMELIKEQLCFVSQNVAADLAESKKGSRSSHRVDYVLPDGVHNLRGFVRAPLTPEQMREQRKAAAFSGQKGLPREQVSAQHSLMFDFITLAPLLLVFVVCLLHLINCRLC